MATADQLESRCNIEIVAVQLADNEPKMMEAVLTRALHHVHRAKKITIFCAEQQPSGWLEYTMHIEYTSGHRLVIGCIRRVPGAEVEFHS